MEANRAPAHTLQARPFVAAGVVAFLALSLGGCVESHYSGTFDIPTSFGPLHVWEFGERGKANKKIAVAIHGGMDVESVHHDFDPIAEKISEYGYYVVAPNFHSLRNTRPSTIDQDGMNRLLVEILKWTGGDNFTMLLGKGWGAGMAGGFAAARPELVERLTLVAPGSILHKGLGNKSIVPETLILHNQDDAAANVMAMERARWLLANEWHYQKEFKGGHKTLPEYTRWILRFARRPVWGGPDNSRWGPMEDEAHRTDEL